MRAQIVLTPSESKRLIGKAVAQMEVVQKAKKKGIIVIARGTTNAFVAEEISGREIAKSNFTAGIITAEGLGSNPKSPKEIVLIDGEVKDGLSIDEMLDKLGPNDVIIKGANAIGPDGIPGLFCGRGSPRATGGTLGKFHSLSLTRGVNVIIPVGLEKLIPCSVLDVYKEVDFYPTDYAMKQPVSLHPMSGTAVTEIDAIKLLTGADALPIGAGGIAGGEGSMTLLVKGADAEVKKAIEIVEKIKGEHPISKPG